MKHFPLALFALIALSGCNGDDASSASSVTTLTAPAPSSTSTATPTVTPVVTTPDQPVSVPTDVPTIIPDPVVTATPSPSASPSPSPSVTVSASPSPSPSPSASPWAFSGGMGTSGAPYEVETAQDVQHIGDESAAYFTVTQDIDMSGVAFKPLAAFSGVLYGNNHRLSNLSVVTTDGSLAAMFTAMSGTIVQLELYNEVASSSGPAAALAGSLTGLVSSCSFAGMITTSGSETFYQTNGQAIYVTSGAGINIVGTDEDFQFNGGRIVNFGI